MKNFILVFILAASCTVKPEEISLRWYKGNTHTHTILCGHADSHPDTVARWYLDRDYNFLILSEHNQFIDPDSVNLPENRRADFILIPGEEVSDYREIHTTALNIDRKVSPQYPVELSSVTDNPYENFKIYLMQKHADSIRSAGGVPILNHPNWQSGAAASEIQQVDRLNMIELYNGHPDVHVWGNKKHASMEQKWDSLLTAGKKVYAVSSDDAHEFKTWGPDVSNPGRGWVMVQSDTLSPQAIADAMEAGKFYATSGVMLKTVEAENDRYKIEVDREATLKSTESPFVVGYKNNENPEGFSIEFISDNGSVIQETVGTSAEIEVPENVVYLRAKVTYSRPRSSKSEQFFAWTQPVFVN